MLRVPGFVLRVLTNEYFDVTMTKHAITGQGKNWSVGVVEYWNIRMVDADCQDFNIKHEIATTKLRPVHEEIIATD